MTPEPVLLVMIRCEDCGELLSCSMVRHPCTTENEHLVRWALLEAHRMEKHREALLLEQGRKFLEWQLLLYSMEPPPESYPNCRCIL